MSYIHTRNRKEEQAQNYYFRSLITHFSVEDSVFSSFCWSLLSAEESCETSGFEEGSDGLSATLLVDDDEDDGSLTSTNLSPETQGKSGGRSTPC